MSRRPARRGVLEWGHTGRKARRPEVRRSEARASEFPPRFRISEGGCDSHWNRKISNIQYPISNPPEGWRDAHPETSEVCPHIRGLFAFQNPEGWGRLPRPALLPRGRGRPGGGQNPEGWVLGRPAGRPNEIPKDGGVIPTTGAKNWCTPNGWVPKFQNPEGWVGPEVRRPEVRASEFPLRFSISEGGRDSHWNRKISNIQYPISNPPEGWGRRPP